jgi:isopenicillin N synthase-like dioxygenase
MSVPPAKDTIPRLDFRQFDAGEAERAAFLSQLRAATHEIGFFYLEGHGISPDLQRDVLDVARRFFSLPQAEKLAIEMVNSPHFRGYNRVASELTRGRRDWREQVDIGADSPALERNPDAPAWAQLRGPNQWPPALPDLRPIITRWQTAAMQLALRLLQAFALMLGQAEDAFAPLYRDEPHYLVKLIRYPGRDATGDEQGVGAHKDSELITLLLQDDHAGLQVETPRGWMDVLPRSGTFVVNIGELLELATDGYLLATTHRVIAPPPGIERLSAAFFFGAQLDATVPILDLPINLRSGARGAARDASNPLFREVGLNYLKGRLRSHPDVAQRHYADLIGR